MKIGDLVELSAKGKALKYCREFMFYTKYLESYAPAPEEAMFVYRKLEEYYVANRH